MHQLLWFHGWLIEYIHQWLSLWMIVSLKYKYWKLQMNVHRTGRAWNHDRFAIRSCINSWLTKYSMEYEHEYWYWVPGMMCWWKATRKQFINGMATSATSIRVLRHCIRGSAHHRVDLQWLDTVSRWSLKRWH